MSAVGFLSEVFAQRGQAQAMVWRDRELSYLWLRSSLTRWSERCVKEGIGLGSVVALEGDFSPHAVAVLLSLVERGAVVVPISRSVDGGRRERLLDMAEVELVVSIDRDDQVDVSRRERRTDHPMLRGLRERGRPGLILFTSGSAGEPRAALHDVVELLSKFRALRDPRRVLTFLLFDHIGGMNTLFYVLSCGGCIVSVEDRSPDRVLAAVEKYGVDLLPTTPSFINLILVSGAHERHDLRSLRTVSYGAEPMPQSTLRRFCALFPHIELKQTYGLTELGILRSRSREPDSLWMKVGDEGTETRIVDGILQIKTRTAMLGYLNAPSPFTEDGWFITGDEVLTEGDYIRVLGRRSEMINVGGEKVFPIEVEGVIKEVSNVADVLVHGEPNSLLGQIVCARVSLIEEEDSRAFARRLKQHCRTRLREVEVPVKVEVAGPLQYTDRYKKARPGRLDEGPGRLPAAAEDGDEGADR